MIEDDNEDFDGRNDPQPVDMNTMDLIKGLQGKTIEELLAEGQKTLLVDLLAKLQTGQASHQEMAILRNLLRDNGMMLGLGAGAGGVSDAPQAGGESTLPTFEAPEYEE